MERGRGELWLILESRRLLLLPISSDCRRLLSPRHLSPNDAKDAVESRREKKEERGRSLALKGGGVKFEDSIPSPSLSP